MEQDWCNYQAGSIIDGNCACLLPGLICGSCLHATHRLSEPVDRVLDSECAMTLPPLVLSPLQQAFIPSVMEQEQCKCQMGSIIIRNCAHSLAGFSCTSCLSDTHG